MINELNLDIILLSFDMLEFLVYIDTYHFPISTGMIIRLVNQNPKSISTYRLSLCVAQRDLKYELKMAEKERNRDKCHVPASCINFIPRVGWDGGGRSRICL